MQKTLFSEGDIKEHFILLNFVIQETTQRGPPLHQFLF